MNTKGLLIQIPQIFGKLYSAHIHLDDLWFHMEQPLDDKDNNKIQPFVLNKFAEPASVNIATLPLVIKAEMIYKRSLQTDKQRWFLDNTIKFCVFRVVCVCLCVCV
jgi:hypothetical protein